MNWYEEEVHAIERAPGGCTPGAVIFYGSSSFRLWTTLAEDLAPWPIINRAFGGSTLAACVHFFERLVVPCAPRSLVCYAGDNDLGDGQSPAAVLDSFRALLTKVDRCIGSIPLAVLSIKPSPARWHLREQIGSVNTAMRGMLAERARSIYIDVATPMLGHDGTPRLELYAADGLHLSQAGYRLWTRIIAAYGDDLLPAELHSPTI